MATDTQTQAAKILILATLSGGYAGADSVGQLHTSYATNTYILPVRCPCMFPAEFYLRTFERGFDAILVMFSGTDSPYKGSSERAAQIINQVYPLMKERGIDTRRLRLVAICTVCTQPFLKEVTQMNQLLEQIGPVKDELAIKRLEIGD
jgi:coenzyme F420-reducing hydrogenase delta subunit